MSIKNTMKKADRAIFILNFKDAGRYLSNSIFMIATPGNIRIKNNSTFVPVIKNKNMMKKINPRVSLNEKFCGFSNTNNKMINPRRINVISVLKVIEDETRIETMLKKISINPKMTAFLSNLENK